MHRKIQTVLFVVLVMDLLYRFLTGRMISPLPEGTDTQTKRGMQRAKLFMEKGLPFLEENSPPRKVQAQVKGTSTNKLQNMITPTSTPVPTPTLLPDAPPNPYMNLLRQYFPPEEVNNASNVMFKESGFNPKALGRNPTSTDYGLFQINDYYQGPNLRKQGLTIEDMLDAVKNIQYAAQIQAQQGWEPWYGADSLGLTSRKNR